MAFFKVCVGRFTENPWPMAMRGNNPFLQINILIPQLERAFQLIARSIIICALATSALR
jgi:hypothetical protein